MRPEGSVVLKWVNVCFVLVYFTKKPHSLGKIIGLKYQSLHCKVTSHISTLCKDIDNHKDLACKGAPLAAQYEGGLSPEIVEIDGLVGADVLQNLSMNRTTECMKDIAWEFPNGLVSDGDANNFLFSGQISVSPSFSCSRPDTFNKYNHIISKYTKCLQS